MKNLLKISFVLFVFAGLTQTTLAQVNSFTSSGAGNVEVNAVINVPITFAGTAVNFGTITTGLTSNVNTGAGTDGSTSTNDGVGASPGSIVITGAEGNDIILDFTNATLDQSTATEVLNFTTVVYDVTADAQVTTGSTVTLSGVVGDGSTTGSITLSVGGTLSPATNAGTYSTTNTSDPVVFTATYN